MSASRRKKVPFRFLWITDPWNTLDHPKDTTLRLAEEALALGAENYWCDAHSIRWESGECRLDAQRIDTIYPGRAEKSFQRSALQTLRPHEFDSIHYRTDPPVDLQYLQPLQILSLGLRSAGKGSRRAEMVNPLSVLTLGNEKLEASVLGDLLPPSISSSQWKPLSEFGQAEVHTVLKPLHQAQSKGIELLHWGNSNERDHAHEQIKKATQGFTLPVLLQRYLPGISDGETRLWFVDGKLLATVRKLPLQGDFRVNMDQGSRLARAELNASERKSAQRIGKHLQTQRIRLAAVDLIDGKITDFNFTSPGLIVQMEGAIGKNLARPIIQALLKPFKKRS